jgi:hypothetical protein
MSTLASAETAVSTTAALDGVKPPVAGNETITKEDVISSVVDVPFLEELESELTARSTAKPKEEVAPAAAAAPEVVPPKTEEIPADEFDSETKLPKRIHVKNWTPEDRRAAKMIQNGDAKDLREAHRMIDAGKGIIPAAPSAPAKPAEMEPPAVVVDGEPTTAEAAAVLVEQLEQEWDEVGAALAEAKKNLRTDEEAELSEKQSKLFTKIRRTERLREKLIVKEADDNDKAQTKYAAEVKASREAVVAKNKAAGVKDSPISKQMASIYEVWQNHDDPRLLDPTAPMLIYRQAAETLGLDPDAVIAEPAAIVPPAKPAEVTPDPSKNGTPAAKATPQTPPLAGGASRVLTPAAPPREDVVKAIGKMSVEEMQEMEEHLIANQNARK